MLKEIDEKRGQLYTFELCTIQTSELSVARGLGQTLGSSPCKGRQIYTVTDSHTTSSRKMISNLIK